MQKSSQSLEDYLEAIVMLGGSPQCSVRSVDVADRLEVSKASVAKAINNMKSLGYVEQEHYGAITLTRAGYEYGASVLERHELLIEFLNKQVGIPQARAEEEACLMEHAISDESFELWRAYINRVSEAPSNGSSC